MYIYHMKTKLLLFSALAFIMLCFNGCTPDEVVTAQEQFKPYTVRLTLLVPIVAPTGNFVSDGVSIAGTSINQGLSSSAPNQVGMDVIEYNGTAVSNTPVNYLIQHVGYSGADNLGNLLYTCKEVKLEIIFDGQLVFNETRVIGLGGCADGYNWNVNLTLL